MVEEIVINNEPVEPVYNEKGEIVQEDGTVVPNPVDVKAQEIIDNNPTPPQEHVKPDYVPDKFWDAETGEVNLEGMAKSYTELEKNFSKPNEEPPTEPTDPEGAKQVLESKGLDFDKYSAEFQEKGELSPETYKELDKVGISAGIVNQFIQGQQALANTVFDRVHNLVGGEETFNTMLEWAKTNLSEAHQNSYNQAVKGTPEQIELAVQGLKAAYDAANGTNPNLQHGDSSSGGGSRFNSSAELTEAINNPKYSNDPAYRKQVEQKLANSSIF